MRNRSGLQIVEKFYNGVSVGYVVGWWFCKRWGWQGATELSFRSIRHGLMFETLKAAKKFRDNIEEKRKASSVKFVSAES